MIRLITDPVGQTLNTHSLKSFSVSEETLGQTDKLSQNQNHGLETCVCVCVRPEVTGVETS